MVAKFVVVAMIYLVWKFKDFLASRAGTSTGPSLLDKIINKMPATIQKAVNYAKGAFAKISPQMIAKAVVITQVASSSYALWAIKNDYDAINAHNGDRREVAEFRKLAYGKLTSLADQHVKALTDALAQKDIGSQDREKLEAEIKKWQTMKAQYQS